MPPPMPHVDGVEHRYAQVNGFRVHYAEAGQGDPVILQHGWPEHWWAWRSQIPALAERYHVICPDLRGFGWSEAPRSGYEKAQLADDLIALLDTLGLDRVRYAGHDWGAFVGYIAAFDHPQRFERLVPMAFGPPWRAGAPDPMMLLLTSYMWLVASPFLGSQALRRGLPKALMRRSRTAGEWTEDELETYQRAFEDEPHANASVQVYRTFLTREMPAMARGGFSDRRLSVPTRLLLGQTDFVRRAFDEDAARKRSDQFSVRVMDGAGHWLPEELPGEVTRELLDFFA